MTGRVTAHGVLDGQTVEIDQRYTRVYVKADGHWQAVGHPGYPRTRG